MAPSAGMLAALMLVVVMAVVETVQGQGQVASNGISLFSEHVSKGALESERGGSSK